LAVDDEKHVRAGFGLRPQEWLIGGEPRIVTDWQGPFSEGAYSRRYASLGLRLIRHMLKEHPLLYSWGHGGEEAPMLQMLRSMKWLLHETPFCFRVVRGGRFLRYNRTLRSTAERRALFDVLALSGAASVGARLAHGAMRLRSGKRFSASAVAVDHFGPWADEVWERGKGHYAALSVRDADTMNAIAPREHGHESWSAPMRLRVERGGQILGWALVTDRTMQGHHNFGDCRVGCLVDYFAEPADAGEVVHAAFDLLRARGVDLVIANQADPRWVQAFVDNGFVKVERRRVFAASPQLAQALEPWDAAKERLFLSNMDGHGPMNL
jgi:hypothetical protein